MSNQLNQSTRIAFTALIHNLRKFAEQQKLPVPNIIQNAFPEREQDPHLHDSFSQWIITTADRIASGFEREEFDKHNETEALKNHSQACLLTLWEHIRLSAQKAVENTDNFTYPLQELSASSIFPQKCNLNHNEKTQAEYAELWQRFTQALKQIPNSHQPRWDLWLDHFDTAYQCFATAIPSAIFKTRADVSLYDHSKTTAALATALWRWHTENKPSDNTQVDKLSHREDWNEEKFLLIQGDFFGIQDFIFSGGSDSNKQAAKLLRGRSFQVSLFTEFAALKVLQACELPPSSQIMNAAGKFLIVAPNTEKIRQATKQVQTELNQWFVEHTYGLIGLGLAQLPASCEDFSNKKFGTLIKKLFEQLEEAKYKRLNLTENLQAVQNISYPHGICRLNRYFPAETEYGENNKNSGLSIISQDQITIGEQLVKKNRILICAQEADVFKTGKTESLRLPIFGYNVIFTENEEETGKFGALVNLQQLYRVWDFSIPKSLNEPVWHGYARRYINAYIPKFNEADNYDAYADKYKNTEETPEIGEIKTFDFIANEDRNFDNKSQKFIGQTALMTLKGDVDNLGTIFQKGLAQPTFAKMASLSRQMNQFFSLWLPAYCAEKSPNMYTVFAGGDDFFLIGPWCSTQKVAGEMQQEFNRYVAENPEIHFSAGMVMSKVGLPVPRLGDLAETALEKSKAIDSGKNAVTIFNRTVKWEKWQQLGELEKKIHHLAKNYDLSKAYIYSLIKLAKMAEEAQQGKMEANIWHSHFLYKTTRYVVDKLQKIEQEQALNILAKQIGQQGLKMLKEDFTIPLFNYLYSVRKSEEKQ